MELKYSINELELLVVVLVVTHYQNYLFGAPFKIITDHKALLSCHSEEKKSKITQTRLIRWVDKLLPFDYEIEQVGEFIRLILPPTSGCSRQNDVITETKTEQELRNRKECAAKKLIALFKTVISSEFVLTTTTERGAVKTASFLIHLKWQIILISINRVPRGMNIGRFLALNVHGTTSSRQPTAKSRIFPAEMFPSILFDWPEFFYSEFISIVTKAEEIFSFVIDALKERNYVANKNLGKYFNHYASKFHTSNEILFMEDKMVIL